MGYLQPKSVTLRGVTAALLLAGIAAPAHAAITLPPPNLEVKTNTGFNAPIDQTSHTGPLSATDTANGATDSASVDLAPTPLLQASATSSAVFASGGSAQGLLTYYFAVTGPTAILVPVLYTATLDATAAVAFDHVNVGGPIENSGAFAFAGLGLQAGSYLNSGWTACAKAGPDAALACPTDPAHRDISGSFTIVPDVGVTVSMSAYASGKYTGQSTAMSDPHFFIDPAFLADHPGFALVFSDGVGNGPTGGGGGTVPEPAAWALMLLGFAGLGARLRARRTAMAWG